jgi:hypothetical protein
MPEHEATTKITLTAIYQLVLDIKEELAPLPKQVSDHEVRIRAIEKYLWIWIGASGVIGAGAGQIINVLINR